MEKRWWVEVWTTAPGVGRYRDAHPRHRERIAAGGATWHDCGSVESVGKVLSREYRTAEGAAQGADRIKAKYANLAVWVEVVSGGVLPLSLLDA